MKLIESLPIVFVALVAVAALAFDDVPAYERAPEPEKRPVLPVKAVPARAVAVDETLSPNEALVAGGAVETATAAPKLTAASTGAADVPKPKAASAGRKPPTPKAPARDVVVHQAEVPRARVEVEERRLSTDERIQHAVIDAIARQPNLTGKVGVEARDAVVLLSGWTMTPGQSLRAERAAARVEGVRQVVNQIRPRMGAITS